MNIDTNSILLYDSIASLPALENSGPALSQSLLHFMNDVVIIFFPSLRCFSASLILRSFAAREAIVLVVS